jgi:hypothetical protein
MANLSHTEKMVELEKFAKARPALTFDQREGKVQEFLDLFGRDALYFQGQYTNEECADIRSIIYGFECSS